jgi:hypothetical protein
MCSRFVRVFFWIEPPSLHPLREPRQTPTPTHAGESVLASKSHPERFQAALSDQNFQGGFDQRHADDTVPLAVRLVAALFAGSNQGGHVRCGD